MLQMIITFAITALFKMSFVKKHTSADIQELISHTSKLSLAQSTVESSNIVFVDDKAKCEEVCKELSSETILALDLEGVDLGRDGKICILQLGCSDGRVYLFDICVLTHDAFTSSGLRRLLEDLDILKIIYDCRADCDALWHHYKVTLVNFIDLQVMYCLPRTMRYLPGLKKVLEVTLLPTQLAKAKKIKDVGYKLFAPEKGGDYQVWVDRPLSPELLEYSAEDVRLSFEIFDKFYLPKDNKILLSKSKSRMERMCNLNPIPPRSDRDFWCEKDF